MVYTMAPTLFNLYACGKVVGENTRDRRSWYMSVVQVGQTETPEEPVVLNVSLLMMWSSLLVLERQQK